MRRGTGSDTPVGMGGEPTEPQQPAPIRPEAFRAARRTVARHWAPRILIVLAVAVGGVVASQWWGLTLTPGRIVTALGLGLDICGVWILAHAVLMTPEELADVGTHRWMRGSSQRGTAVRNRAEGLLGVSLAVVGFILQLISNLLPPS
jgi:hypothetical protein